MENSFTRLQIIIGKEKLEILKNKHVAVFGLGGVGGFCLEALCRSGIGNFTIVDYDTVDVTNINRQIIATTKTIGEYKTDLFEKRIKEINPNAKINKINRKYCEENKEEFFDKYDYVVDAIDMVSSKINLIKTTFEKRIPIISSMGMGNKLNPLDIELTTINKTQMCKLARVMRKELKQLGIENLKCVYSKEKTNISETYLNGNKLINGSTSFVPSVAGLVMASEVVKDLINY